MATKQRKRVSKKNNDKHMLKRSVAIVSAVTAVISLTLGVQILELKAESKEYDLVIEEWNDRMDEEFKRAEEIEEYKVYTEIDEYVEQIAREKLGMVYPDETIFIAIK